MLVLPIPYLQSQVKGLSTATSAMNSSPRETLLLPNRVYTPPVRTTPSSTLPLTSENVGKALTFMVASIGALLLYNLSETMAGRPRKERAPKAERVKREKAAKQQELFQPVRMQRHSGAPVPSVVALEAHFQRSTS